MFTISDTRVWYKCRLVSRRGDVLFLVDYIVKNCHFNPQKLKDYTNSENFAKMILMTHYQAFKN